MNREFYSYVLYLKAKKLGYNVNYHKDFTETAEKYLKFTNKENEEIKIAYKEDLSLSSYGYVAINLENGSNLTNKNINCILDFIANNI